MFRLDGRTALITGGGEGLGAAIANVFTQAGAHVVVAGPRRVIEASPFKTLMRLTSFGSRAVCIPSLRCVSGTADCGGWNRRA